MAKHTDKFDPFKDSPDLEFDIDTDIEDTVVPKDRSPLTEAAKGAGAGIVDGMIGEDRRRDLILKALPKEYSSAYREYKQVRYVGRDIYREARQQLRETQRLLKQTGREVLPVVKPFMPKSWYEKLNDLTKDKNLGYYDPQQAEMDSASSSIFGSSEESPREEATEELEAKAKGEVDGQIKTLQLAKLYEGIVNIDNNTSKMVSYQNTVTTNYRRKMLELAYRQYFAITDLVTVVKNTSEKLVPGVESIVHNTALPDYAKEEFSEITKAQMKRKVIEKLSPVNFLSDYWTRNGEAIKGNVKDFIGGLNSAIGLGGMVTGMFESDNPDDMFRETPLSDNEVKANAFRNAAQMAGSVFAENYINPHVDKLASKTRGKLNNMSWIRKFGVDALHMLKSAPSSINTMNRGDVSHDEYGWLGKFTKSFGFLFDQSNGDNLSVSMPDIQDLKKPAAWSSRSDHTLNVIIPAILTKIDQSVRRIYDPAAKLEQYDYKTLKFSTVSDIAKRVRETLDDDTHKNLIKSRYDAISKQLGIDKLSKDAQESFHKYLDQTVINSTDFNLDILSKNQGAFGNIRYNDAAELSGHFATKITNPIQRKELSISVLDELRNVAQLRGDKTDKVKELIDLYGQNALINANILQKDGFGGYKINNDLFDNNARVKESTDPDVLKEIMDQAASTNLPPNLSSKRKPTIDINSVMNNMTEVNSRMVALGVSQALYGDGKQQTLKSVLKSLRDKKITEEGKKHVLEPILNDIKAQLEANNVKPELEMVIEGILELMTNTEIMAADQTTLKGIAKNSALWAFRKGKKLGNLAAHYAGKANARVRGWYQKISENIPAAWERTKTTVSESFDAAKKTAGTFFDSLLGKLDIYDDEGKIIFAGQWIKEGYYRNEDGEPIKSLKDIKGAIYDPKRNIIYTAEQVNEFMTKLRYWTTTGWKTVPMTAGKWAGAILNKAFKLPTAAWDIASKVGKRVFYEFWTSRDIYVKPDLENPRLTHALMVKGFYINKNTGEVVRDVSDIHGPIINKYKEVVISEDELKDPNFQLVDVDGKPFKSISEHLMDFIGKAKDLAVGAFNWGMKGIGKIKDTAMASWDWLSGWIKSGKAMSLGGFSLSFGGDKTYERINDIYKLLLDRFGDPKKKKKERTKSRAGSSYKSKEDGSDDTDGNGIRDNSWKDYYNRRKKEREEKLKNGNTVIGSIKDKIKASAKSGWDLISSLVSPLGIAAKSMAGAFLGAVGRGIGGVGKSLALSFVKYAKAGLSKAWNLIKHPGKWLAGGAKAVGRGILNVAKWGLRNVLWQGVRMVAGAAVGLLSAPAIIIGAVIAGVSYGAYKLATRKTVPLIDQVRFAQYGTEDYSRADLDDVAKIRFLEDQVLKHVAYDSRGMSMIRGIPANDLAAIQKGWGLDPTEEDRTKLDRWQKWFMGRFVPVFLLWTTRAKQCIPERKFTEIGDFSKYSPKDAKILLNKCDLRDDHPIYNVETGPFNDEDLNDGDDVREVFNDVMEEVEDAIADMPETKKADIAKRYEEQVKKGYVGYGQQAQAIPKASLVPRKPSVGKEAVDVGPNGLDHPVTAGSITTITSTNADDKRRHPGSQINALDAVRLKTYGLISMSYQHIEMIYRLEDLVMPSIIRNGRFWEFSGDLKKIVPTGLTIFGLAKDTIQAAGFNSWLQFRFIPTLVQYVNAVYKQLPNVNPFALQLEGISKFAFDIAHETRSAMVTIPGNERPVSVWTVRYSPWGDNTPINTDMFGSVQGNMNYLEDLRKQTKVNEQTKINNGLKVTTAKNIKKTVYKGKQYNTSMGEYIMTGNVSGEKGGSKSTVYDNVFNSSGVVAGGSTVDYDYDSAIANGVGPGVGGYYDIKRTTNDTAGLADVIIQASKIVGLDPTLALNIAMLESYPSLKPRAKAGTSSAKGLFQFVNDTWKGMIKQYGAQYGLPDNASPYDPVANALMGAQYVKNGIERVKRTTGRPATAADAYLMHFMGDGDGPKFLQALATNPGANAAMMFPTPAASNHDIFFAGGKPLSIAGVYALIQQKVRSIRSYAVKYTGADPNPWLKNKKLPTAANDSSAKPTIPSITNKGVIEGNPFTGGSSVPAYTPEEAKNAAVGKAMETAKVAAIKAGATPTEKANYTKIAATVAKETAENDSNSAAIAASKEAVDSNIILAQASKTNNVASVAKTMAKQVRDSDNSSYSILKDQLLTQQDILKVLREISGKGGMTTTANTNTTMSNKKEPTAPTITHGDEPISLRRISG